MELAQLKMKYLPKERNFYRDYYHYILWLLMLLILLIGGIASFILYQVTHKPLPSYQAIASNGQRMNLEPFLEPNQLPDTIIRWANKAATAAYTFNFGRYKEQILAVRPYFTDGGWNDYLRSIQGLIESITQKQLYISSVVSGASVISNQGDVPGKGMAWRVQIPFLVSYSAGGKPYTKHFLVLLTIVRISTSINPQGIGIDQFVMRG